MKLIELEITEIRGIKSLTIKPEGSNFVISGPNGSGKSGVVDALDFLLTGNIKRMSGKGTSGITLRRHGAHVGSKAKDTEVRAVVKLNNSDTKVEIRRSISDPETLIFPAEAESSLAPIIAYAKQGQHVLSRREILNFITAESKSRAGQIQSLLNLSELDSYRDAFIKVRTEAKQLFGSAELKLRKTRQNIESLVLDGEYSDEALRDKVNELRKILGGEILGPNENVDLKRDLVAPHARTIPAVNLTIFTENIGKLGNLIVPEKIAERREKIHSLKSSIAALNADAKILLEIKRLELFKLGIILIDDSGACPLCDKPWEPSELEQYLSEKISVSSRASEILKQIRTDCEYLQKHTRTASTLLEEITDVASGETTLEPILVQCKEKIDALTECLDNPLIADISNDAIEMLCIPISAMELVNAYKDNLAKSIPQTTPEQTAWEMLVRLEEYTKNLHGEQLDFVRAKKTYDRSCVLFDEFHKSRDLVLSSLYEQIKDKFVLLYRDIHGTDESNFEAILEPDSAGMKFEVDFYGKGLHPPHALHSEGHQDSMGLCLYLALVGHLSQGVSKLIILDDVVMSVDTGHRKEVCKVINNHFSDCQFLITTHERAWAGQLRTEKVVASKNMLNFYGWTLDRGPHVESMDDMWKIIQDDLERNEINRAAHRLRYGMEDFFRRACANLKGSVPYNNAEKWELGEFYSGAYSRLNAYIKDSIKAEKSWGNESKVASLTQFQSFLQQSNTKAEAEKVAINPTVHFNDWTNYSRQDFEPIVQSIQEFCQHFMCNQCGQMLEAQGTGSEIKIVKCPCGHVILNLERKQ